ncbi:FkbM family methyltransferase [Rhodobacteraceae bacterium R_SAG3]|uniref:FkbM family methyltransferase n=1 Tax=Tritonibacter mobilis TaxID=379347 RepID=UPI0013A54FF5|nr:FkbM family methyltransferase [Tritonibacter mobilis]NKX74005.1 FkbM family methyltransferase [Rhodobacteraceae bacterium R_SAG3]
MPSLLNFISRVYRRISPVRRVLVRLEDRLEHVERTIVDGQAQERANGHQIRDEIAGRLARSEERLTTTLYPLGQFDEFENQVLRRFDEQLLEAGKTGTRIGEQLDAVAAAQARTGEQLSKTANDLARFEAGINEALYPLTRFDEFENQMLRRFDEQLLEAGNTGTRVGKQLDAVAAAQARTGEQLSKTANDLARLEAGLNEALHPLNRFGELEAQMRQCFDEQIRLISDDSIKLVQALGAMGEQLRRVETMSQDAVGRVASSSELSEIRGGIEKLQSLPAQYDSLSGRLEEVRTDLTGATKSVQDTKSSLARTHEQHAQELRTVISLQERLVAQGLGLPAGPQDLPDFRELALALENGEVTLADDQPSIQFLGHELHFDDLFSVYVVYKEIYLYEDYFAKLTNDTPRIIDGGSHIGMATLYFKDRYPKAKITCFEPDPRNFELLIKNTEHLGDDVERFNLALTEDGADYPLLRREGQSMASSVHARYRHLQPVDNVMVHSSKLSAYLEAPVDILKLDIEGPEDRVLHESKHLLGNVHYLFIEFHTGDQLPLSRLTAILGMLDEAGFTYQIERAREYQTRMMHRPFTHLDHLCTHVIHAKNLNWDKSQHRHKEHTP